MVYFKNFEGYLAQIEIAIKVPCSLLQKRSFSALASASPYRLGATRVDMCSTVKIFYCSICLEMCRIEIE